MNTKISDVGTSRIVALRRAIDLLSTIISLRDDRLGLHETTSRPSSLMTQILDGIIKHFNI